MVDAPAHAVRVVAGDERVLDVAVRVKAVQSAAVPGSGVPGERARRNRDVTPVVADRPAGELRRVPGDRGVFEVQRAVVYENRAATSDLHIAAAEGGVFKPESSRAEYAEQAKLRRGRAADDLGAVALDRDIGLNKRKAIKAVVRGDERMRAFRQDDGVRSARRAGTIGVGRPTVIGIYNRFDQRALSVGDDRGIYRVDRHGSRLRRTLREREQERCAGDGVSELAPPF